MSLLHGWLPWALQAATVLAIVLTAGMRDRSWLRRRFPTAVLIGIVLSAVAAVALPAMLALTDPLPATFWLWAGAMVVALCVLVVVWRGARWRQRVAGLVAVLLAVMTAANSLNIWTGYYPTIDDALSDATHRPVSHQIGIDQLGVVPAETTTGRVVAADLPARISHFPHRQELVYLPPAWFRSHGQYRLPVLEMIGGQVGSPADWIRAGNAVATADAYAAQHGGVAPILVFVDPSGDFAVDSECVNGLWGNAEDYLLQDIPRDVVRTFGASADPRNWGVAGWSMGGTCAFDLVVEHPEAFRHFEDISGDLGPNLGSRQDTIRKLYHGDTTAWAEHDPLTVLGHHARYLDTSGWFAAGTAETGHARQATQLNAAAQRAGITTRLIIEPGNHSWRFAARAFAEALPWLTNELSGRA